MRLRLDDITAEERHVNFAEPEADMNRTLSLGSVQEYRLLRAVDVWIAYYRAGTEIFIHGAVDADLAANCARCAEEFTTQRGRRFRYVLTPASISDATPGNGEIEYSVYRGEEVDLSPMVREQVLLALTERPLCREDCRGLCPRCGANLNQVSCACRAEIDDPRLAILRSLRPGRSGLN
jgi:uncharacterized protein